jgi:MEKHLA domain-containing protein
MAFRNPLPGTGGPNRVDPPNDFEKDEQMDFDNQPLDLSVDARFFDLLTSSYYRLVGKRLVEAGRGAQWLYHHANFVVVAHNTDADPRFIYANQGAQICFGYSWDEFMALPSRLTAEAPGRAERQALLDSVRRKGFASGYRGLRITKSGRRFWIEDGVVWQLVGKDGMTYGQAATFRKWRAV